MRDLIVVLERSASTPMPAHLPTDGVIIGQLGMQMLQIK